MNIKNRKRRKPNLKNKIYSAQKPEKKIGEYSIIRGLGKGGNGVVYEVRHGANRFAMKTLIDFSRTARYTRFRNEVKALQDVGPIENVLKLIDFSLPEEPKTGDIPFYTMPIGIPYVKYLEGKSHKTLFTDFLKIVNAVTVLHSKEYTHRDIKPDNLLYIDNEPVLSDFGLVSFPNKSGKSGKNEKIGPQWTIAPEMQRTSSTAEFKKADVYSLAKTLWILITGSKFGFEGQYIPKSNISIDSYVEVMINKSTMAGEWCYHSTVILDQLLSAATDNDPSKRPTAAEFHDILQFWLRSNSRFEERNPLEWDDALKTIFPYGSPEYCEWTDTTQIFSVMKRMIAYDNLNYFFYPEHGGDMMKNISLTNDEKTLIINNTILICALKLVFRSNLEKDIAYFRLIVRQQDAFTQAEDNAFSEDYIADTDYQIIGEIGSDAQGIEVERYLKGSFIFVNKRSPINALIGVYRDDLFLDGHSGIHEKIPHDEYHQMLIDYC